MKKTLKKIIILVFALSMVTLPKEHVHDDKCGYDPITGEGCIYEIELCDDKRTGD